MLRKLNIVVFLNATGSEENWFNYLIYSICLAAPWTCFTTNCVLEGVHLMGLFSTHQRF